MNEEQDLERQVGEVLRRMPMRRAPSGLAARVMEAVGAHQRLPWWRLAYWSWPAWARVLLISWLVGMAAGLVALGFLGGEWAAAQVAGWGSRGAALWNPIQVLGEAGLVVLRQVLRPWLLGAWAVSLVMYLFCLGAGTAYFRLVWRRVESGAQS